VLEKDVHWLQFNAPPDQSVTYGLLLAQNGTDYLSLPVPGEIAHDLQVRTYCSLGVITTLEFLQHHFA
jgi:hypothetical protein